MDNYTDKTYDGIGSNWIRASKSAAWTSFGGDFLTTSGNFVDITFKNGDEDCRFFELICGFYISSIDLIFGTPLRILRLLPEHSFCQRHTLAIFF